MTDDELVAAIRKGVAAELEARARIDAETHRAHHAWVAQQVECAIKRRELAEKAAQQVLGWGAVIGIAWMGKVIWTAIMASKGAQ